MVFKLTTLEIPMNHFDFVPFQEILSATNEDQLIGKFDVSFSMIHCCLLFVALLFDYIIIAHLS
jgi:hypothetical protein